MGVLGNDFYVGEWGWKKTVAKESQRNEKKEKSNVKEDPDGKFIG